MITKGERRDILRGIFFISPWIIGLCMFILYPIVASFYYSFTEYNIILPPTVIGVDNFKEIGSDPLFWKSISNTFLYAIVSLPLMMTAALAVALLLNQPVRFKGIFRTIYFIPSLVPLVPLAILWMWIFNGEYGILNSFLKHILAPYGIPTPNWMGSPYWTKPALVIASLWGIGGTIVIFLASLQEVPRQLYEAAEIDGANSLQRLRHVTIPMISPVIYFNLVMGIINTLQVFAVPYVMFRRGPGNSTLFFAMYIYDNAFRYLKMGYASAMSWIMFVIILTMTIIATRISKKHIHYAGE